MVTKQEELESMNGLFQTLATAYVTTVLQVVKQHDETMEECMNSLEDGSSMV